MMAAVAALALAGAACSNSLSGTCSQNGVWGIQVSVRDQNGGAQADSALGVLTDVLYRDTMKIQGLDINGVPLILAGARDRAGTYDMCIRKTGFADYIQKNIVVPATACGVSPQLFEVTLVPPAQNSPVCSI